MLLVYLALFALALVGSKISIKSFNTQNYLSMDSTNSMRGIFVMLVFLSHFMQYYTYTDAIDTAGGKISRTLGQMIVVMFLFYSGYGIGESIKRKGTSYVKSFPKNRVLKTLLHFDIAILIYFIMSLFLGSGYSPSKVLLSFIGWESIGNSNWYIFAVIILYLLTWLGFTLVKKDKIYAAVLVTGLVFAYVCIISRVKENWWFDTAPCFAAGLWYSFLKEKFERLLTRNNIVWLAIAGMSLVCWYWCCKYRSVPPMRMVEALLFALFTVTVSLKITFNNKVLIWLGKHTFEIYVLMRIPMKLLSMWGLKDYNLYIYFFASLAATIVLSVIFSYLLKGVDKLLFRPRKA